MTIVLATRKSAMIIALIAFIAFCAQAGSSVQVARADGCAQSGPALGYCNYAGESVPKYTPRWLEVGNNLRYWYANEIADAYGGSVSKCTGYKKEGSGIGTWLNCGTGTFSSPINGGYRGWIFIEQLANGPRIIYGQGRHNIICC